VKNSRLKTQQLDIGKIKQNLKTAWLGKDIRYFTEVDSTNTVAKTLAEQGVEEDLRATATSLKEILRREIDRKIFICNLLKEFEFYYENFRKGKVNLILSKWKKFRVFLTVECSFPVAAKKSRELPTTSMRMDG